MPNTSSSIKERIEEIPRNGWIVLKRYENGPLNARKVLILEHDCLQVIEQVYSSRPDLKDMPLEIEPKPLPVNTSAQKAEIVALTRVLELSENMRVNVYTDSKYAFGVTHAHGTIWKERGLLSSEGTPIKHGKAILNLLQAVLKSNKVSVMHCKAHQKGQTDIISGNRKADETAKRVALTDSKVGALIPTGRILLERRTYLEKDNQLAKLLNCTETKDRWWTTDTGQIIVTAPLMRELIKKTHQETHMGAGAVVANIRRYAIGPRMQKLANTIVKQCSICCKNNPKIQKDLLRDKLKGDKLQGNTFSEWPEAFPCQTNKAREVVRVLLKEIIPRFSIPEGIASVAKFLQFDWNLHTPWRLQSNGKVERMNQTLKRQISK
ncbi:hypothetical protein QYF61_007069 [Mycteria americana]|uniref:RNase H type-1 domain-containing protein n=1 Tax=Mycteria americana TaxID=33587 RepID=A0AAN7S643_MYCAM|nr:hypothetical protein QYF61_007069 [Mycteria americana]